MPCDPSPAFRQQIVALARDWIGTPFQHQGRLKGVGVDCAGLVIGVTRELGLAPEDRPTYGHAPDRYVLGEMLDRQARLKGRDGACAEPGDLLLFWVSDRRYPQHLGIATGRQNGDLMMVHAYARPGKNKLNKVLEMPLGPYFYSRLVAVYAIPGGTHG
ncbi:MAG: C40 family peptidase [Magnetospiraceae bacterium]